MRVLIIDDELIALERMRDIVKSVLPDANITVFQKPSAVMDYVEMNPVDIVFMDINMPGITGIELAKRLKTMSPTLNIVFTTGYSEYALESYKLNASGYLMKPITEEAVREQLDNLRYPVEIQRTQRVVVKCFGNFELFVDGQIVNFKYDKTKELLAYLVDREGSGCTNREIMVALWEDDDHKSYLSNLKKDLNDTLESLGCQDIVESSWGKMAIKTSKLSCDYYDWKAGLPAGIHAYNGEYMSQYSWSEVTGANILKEK